MTFLVPEKYRVKTGPVASTAQDGNNGAFVIKSIKLKTPLYCIASDGFGWEHVSVSVTPEPFPFDDGRGK